MEEENNQEKTVEEEVAEEAAKEEADTTDDESGEGVEVKAEENKEDYVDLTKDEVQEEKKFQDTINAAESLDTQEKVEQAKKDIISESETPSEQVPDIEPAEQTETTEEKPAEIPTETANVIKDQDLIFLQYECTEPTCEFKFWINNAEKDIGDKLKCFRCGKKLMKKRRLFDVNIKQYKIIEEEKKEEQNDFL